MSVALRWRSPGRALQDVCLGCPSSRMSATEAERQLCTSELGGVPHRSPQGRPVHSSRLAQTQDQHLQKNSVSTSWMSAGKRCRKHGSNSSMTLNSNFTGPKNYSEPQWRHSLWPYGGQVGADVLLKMEPRLQGSLSQHFWVRWGGANRTERS